MCIFFQYKGVNYTFQIKGKIHISNRTYFVLKTNYRLYSFKMYLKRFLANKSMKLLQKNKNCGGALLHRIQNNNYNILKLK